MCGIAVAFEWDDAAKVVAKMLQGIEHRGDITDPIICPASDIAMATRRLRIVDATLGQQPQLSYDGRLLISFNGEIYNHRELRNQLRAMGVPFRSESDTEVLVNALQVWGLQALERLNGMFAFVVVDIESGDFLAARDPFGVKPLYIVQSEDGEGYLFCSEMRPLLDASEKGDVLLLPPGYMLTKKTCSRYRTALGGPFSGSEPGDVRTLDHLMFDAVKSRLPDGLPVAVQLSGGIDSTLVAHYARQSRTHVPCYFLGNPGAPDYRYVVEYAELSGADLRILPFDPAAPTMRSEIDHAIAVSESFEPTVVRGAVCSNRVAEAMHLDGFRVALAGEGADELFAGYIPLEEGFLHSNAAGRALRAECLDMMHRTCLQRIDRSGMRYELEVREPFLDPRIAAYALELAPSALVGSVGGHIRGKKALRDLYDLYSEQLPRSIRDRSKVPFGEGAGMDANRNEAVWLGYFEDAISNRDFRDGQKEFAAYEIISKEELYYLRKLASVMDISRIPHLRGRVKLSALPDSDVPQQIAVA